MSCLCGLVDCIEYFDHVDTLLGDIIGLSSVEDDIDEVLKCGMMTADFFAAIGMKIDKLVVFFGENVQRSGIIPTNTRLVAAKLNKTCFIFNIGCPAEFDL